MSELKAGLNEDSIMIDKDDHYFSPQVNTKTNRAKALFSEEVHIEANASAINNNKKVAFSVQTNVRGDGSS